jgi:hypothetical protein
VTVVRRIGAKLAMGMAALLLMGGLLAAGNKSGSSRRGVAEAQTGARGNANRQWTADPERGWLRANERQQLRAGCGRAASNRGASSDRAQNCEPKETDGKDRPFQNKPTDLGVDY